MLTLKFDHVILASASSSFTSKCPFTDRLPRYVTTSSTSEEESQILEVLKERQRGRLFAEGKTVRRRIVGRKRRKAMIQLPLTDCLSSERLGFL